MNDFLRYPPEDGDSVVKESLTTAADDQNCRGAQYKLCAIGSSPILYTLCRESRLPDLYAMFPNWNALRSEFKRADRDLYSAATVKESLSVQTEGESEVFDHFRGITQMVEPGNNRRRHHDGR